MKLVVGERNLRSIDTSVKNGILMKKYGYESDTVKEDVEEYISYLLNNAGFFDLSSETDDENVYGKESQSEGQIILVRIDSSPSGYTITLRNGELR